MATTSNGTAQNSDSLAGLLQINDRNLADFEYSELFQPTQFFNLLPWRVASHGEYHKWLVESAAPTAGFRDINEGVNNQAGQEYVKEARLRYLDGSFDRDIALCEASGNRLGADAYLERETFKSLTASMARAERQLVLGSKAPDGDASKGYDGLADLAQLWDGMGINAGGSGGTRVYMMIVGLEDVCGVLGYNGRFTVQGPDNVRMTDSAGKPYTAKRVTMGGYMCLQAAGKFSIATAFNIDGTDGKKVTDDLLVDLYTLFPSDRAQRVNCIAMSRKGLAQLQKSRTATTATGATAPIPTTWDNAGRPIPIVIIDAIDDEEAAVTTPTAATSGE